LFSLERRATGVKSTAGARVTREVKKTGLIISRSGLDSVGKSPPRNAAPMAAK